MTAISFILARLIWPSLQFDMITIGLLIVTILPWLTSLIESAKFPGGWEIKFRDIQAAGDKVTGSSPTTAAESTLPTPSFLSIATQDPNLALVGLRIEIETRVRELISRYDIPEQSLSRMIDALLKRGVFDQQLFSGLKELVFAGNKAAHGASVEPLIAQWAIEDGPAILATLDRKLEEIPPRLGRFST